MRRRVAVAVLLNCALVLRAGAQQQIVDPDFKPVVQRPAYRQNGPVVAIDEAHANFHTASGQYKPFADLLTNDGYTVKASKLKFAKAALAGINVLVIANALSANATRDNPGMAAFTEQECDAVRNWVRQGGSLLLIADHAPFGGAAENLARRFGVSMGNGWAFDRAPAGGTTTQLVFSLENRLLGTHPILRGRDASEQIKLVRTFTGQSLTVPDGATVLLKMSATSGEAPTPEAVNAPDAARASPAAGRAQGIAMPFGQGRVVILGEAGMFSAQIATLVDGNDTLELKFGMNVPGHDDQQLALNILHWLSGLIR